MTPDTVTDAEEVLIDSWRRADGALDWARFLHTIQGWCDAFGWSLEYGEAGDASCAIFGPETNAYLVLPLVNHRQDDTPDVMKKAGRENNDQNAMANIEAGKIYAIDGGFFQAHRNEENERLELWTYEGLSGHVVARTGFDIGPDGRLFHRIFDFETEEHIVFESSYTVDDLVEDDVRDDPPAGS